MCEEIVDPRVAPLTQAHISVCQDQYPYLREEVEGMSRAISSDLTPSCNVLAMFTVMLHHLKHGKYGLLQAFRAVRVPLSIVADGTRFRPQIVSELHATVIPWNMAEKNRALLNQFLSSLGIRVFMTCSCGVVMIREEDFEAFLRSPLLRQLDLFRSSLDRVGAPVVDGISWEEVPENNIDITAAERTMFGEIETLVALMAAVAPYGIPEAAQLLQQPDIANAEAALLKHANAMREAAAVLA